MYFRDSRLLVVALDNKRRSDFEQHFPSIMGRLASELVMSPGTRSQLNGLLYAWWVLGCLAFDLMNFQQRRGNDRLGNSVILPVRTY
ncbi:hypothetical protein BYT27DRAFT_6752065 [Phlegmacium glaucopus]|nr:hypothetical protein BYT27DRAFT_6752065 [Phlegmacium glaucopus]